MPNPTALSAIPSPETIRAPAVVQPRELSPKEPPRPYRTELPSGFSEDIWRRITASVTGAEGILSETQQLAVLRWALDRKTLTQEMELLGKPKSAQIWKVLDSTGCLAYEMKS